MIVEIPDDLVYCVASALAEKIAERRAYSARNINVSSAVAQDARRLTAQLEDLYA